MNSFDGIFGGMFEGLPSGIGGEENYYAKNCHSCGKELVAQTDGRHEDENDRGYCQLCSARRAAPAKPNYSGQEMKREEPK